MKNNNSLKRPVLTNLCLVAIMALVYMMAFTPFGLTDSIGAVLKGNTGEQNVALQIAVDDSSDLTAYMEALDAVGVKATFFFCEQCYRENNEVLEQVVKNGHGIGYYTSADGSGSPDLYIGGGYSIPVMNYAEDNGVQQVCPSIDVTKLKSTDGWQQVLSENMIADMFLYIDADNNFEDFEKIVQIVLDKGYTILKVNEML